MHQMMSLLCLELDKTQQIGTVLCTISDRNIVNHTATGNAHLVIYLSQISKFQIDYENFNAPHPSYCMTS